MRLIHCSDIHLDSPLDTNLTREQASVRNNEIIQSFVRMTEYAVKNNVRAVLISGDLFDSTRIRRSTYNIVLDTISKTPSVDYLYLPGNHDEENCFISDSPLPQNLKCFKAGWKTYTYENVSVSGTVINSDNYQTIYNDIPVVKGNINVIMLHGPVGNSDDEKTINLNILKNYKIDYLALGHIHSYILNRLGTVGSYCYSGCLEGRGFDECGPKGFVVLDTTENKIQSQFVSFSFRELHRISVDISGLQNTSAILQSMMEAADCILQKDLVEFVLIGAVDPAFSVPVLYLKNAFSGRFFHCKIKDETHISINPENYINDISLKGEFIRLVLSGDENEEDKEKIIRAGLQALMGEDIQL